MRIRRPSLHVTFVVATKLWPQIWFTPIFLLSIAATLVPKSLLAVTHSSLTLLLGMSTDKQFVNTLEDNIRYRGAMDKLISDQAQLEISNRAKDLLRAMAINNW
jgi:hypothetical protein